MAENENLEPEEEQQVDEEASSQEQAEEDAVMEESTVAEDVTETPSDETASAADSPEVMPEASFSTLVTILGAQAIGALGEGVPGDGEQPTVRLELARYHIDSLTVLQEKTKGNLSDEEGSLLEQLLHQLRILYVSVQQKTDSTE